MSDQQSETVTQSDGLDRFKTVVVYGTAAIAVLGGLAVLTLLMVVDKLDVEVGVPSLLIIIGGGVQFLFAEVQSKRTEQAMERANLVARSTVNGYVQAPNAPVTPAAAVPGPSSDPGAPASSAT